MTTLLDEDQNVKAKLAVNGSGLQPKNQKISSSLIA